MQRLIKAALKWPCSELEQCRGIFTSENLIQNIAKFRNCPDLTILYHYITMLISLFITIMVMVVVVLKNQPFLILPFFILKFVKIMIKIMIRVDQDDEKDRDDCLIVMYDCCKEGSSHC